MQSDLTPYADEIMILRSSACSRCLDHLRYSKKNNLFNFCAVLLNMHVHILLESKCFLGSTSEKSAN
ncbi:hypothetical protein ACFX19_034233 [Malus domestica]